MILGNCRLRRPLLIAPLAGITDAPYRLILRQMGAELAYTEMISAKGLVYGNQQTREYLRWDPADRPIGIQLFGSEEDVLEEALLILQDQVDFDFLDLNMGCPVRKILQNGDGCRLMQDVKKASGILRRLRRRTEKALSLKMRLGLTRSEPKALELARAAEAEGADFVTVHGRYAEDMYSGKADWEAIAAIKKELQIPLVGNGDVYTLGDYQRVKGYGTAGVMLARGIIGNPFLVAEIKAFEEGEPFEPFTLKEKMLWMLKHLDLHLAMKGEGLISEFRTHAMNYTKGVRGSAKVRRAISQASSWSDFESLAQEVMRGQEEQRSDHSQ